MPQYAILGRHEAIGCPMNSKAARAAAQKAYGSLEQEGNAKHVKMILNIHLDPAHKALMLFDAPSAEAVRDCLVGCGFVGFLDMNLYLVTPIEELLKSSSNMPTIYP